MSPLQSNADYKRAFALVRGVFAEWDPYALLTNGSPKDEFDAEVAQIVAAIPRIKSGSDARDAVSKVFSHWFEPESFAPESCADVGLKLFNQLRESGFV